MSTLVQTPAIPTKADVDVLYMDCVAAWHAIDLAMAFGNVRAVRGCEEEFRACLKAYTEATDRRHRALSEV